jgi:type I restriction enzyme S subunit
MPPILEQKRIVAILEYTFKAIDQAKTNAEQNLKNAKAILTFG